MDGKPNKDILRIGIVGSGGRGINCFGKIISERDDAAIVALTDTNQPRMEAAAKQLGKPLRYYGELEEMISREGLDGVIVTTPDFLHADHVSRALKAGAKYVLVDKPLATTSEGCKQVIEAMRHTNGRVTMGFNLRHHVVVRTIKQIIESGEIGNIMFMENREFYDLGRTYMARWNRNYELSGGLWIHKGSHDFDIFNWFNPKGTPVRVSAFAGVNALRPDNIPFEVKEGTSVGPTCSLCAYKDICPDYHQPVAGTMLYNTETSSADGYVQDLCIYTSDKSVHDNGIAMVEYDNNVRASHIECFVCNFTDRIYTIAGDRGTLTASIHDSVVEVTPRWGEKRRIEVAAESQEDHGGADPHLVESFISSIKLGAPNPSTVRDGVRSVAVGHAAELSWREHRMVDIKDLIDLYHLDLAE